MDGYNFVSLIGLFVLMGVAWGISNNRRRVPARLIFWGLAFQLAFGALVFLTPLGADIFIYLGKAFNKLMEAAGHGAAFCFGPLAAGPGQEGSIGFILAFQALPTIVFFSALMGVLYFIGLMPRLIRGFARFFTHRMGLSGAESLCASSNIFVGIESATTILPYLDDMTPSELCTVLTAGLATIASSMLGLYVMVLHEDVPGIAGHLMSASVLSAPAALIMSKLIYPETGSPATAGHCVQLHEERADNVIEAAIRGATAGGRLVLGVIVMLLAFLGLVAVLNMLLGAAGSGIAGLFGWDFRPTLQGVLAYIYYPFTLIIGVPPSDAMPVARLLGIRTIMTEIPAYAQLSKELQAGTFHHARSPVLAAYALCGFAHVASVAIFVGGIAALAPRQTSTLSRVALRALAAATLACLMTAAVAGVFFNGAIRTFLTGG